MAGQPYCYPYPRPAVTVDLVLFALRKGVLQVLLIRRKKDPFAGRWAIPGGFLDIDERVEDAVLRELKEETGVEGIPLMSPLGVFAEPRRDPRGRTISLAYVGVVREPIPEPKGGDDAAEAAWHDLDEVGGLAFDHDLILDQAVDWLGEAVDTRPRRGWPSCRRPSATRTSAGSTNRSAARRKRPSPGGSDSRRRGGSSPSTARRPTSGPSRSRTRSRKADPSALRGSGRPRRGCRSPSSGGSCSPTRCCRRAGRPPLVRGGG